MHFALAWNERFTQARLFVTVFVAMKMTAQTDPVIEFYARDVDHSLLRENLKLTPAQRLEKLVRFSSFASTLKRAGKLARTRAKR